MVVVACIDKVDRLSISSFIHNQITILVSLVVQRFCIANARNSYSFNSNSFFFVQPNGILLQIREGFLGITSELIKSSLQNLTDTSVHHFIQSQIRRYFFAYSVYGFKRNNFHLFRNHYGMSFIQPNRILVQRVLPGKSFLGIAFKLHQTSE